MKENLSHVLLPANRRLLEDVRRTYPAGRIERFTNGVEMFYCYVVPETENSQALTIPVLRQGRFVETPPEQLHGIIHSGDMRIDLDNDLVWLQDTALHLPGAELLLLKILVLNSSTYITRRMLLNVLERRTRKVMQDNTLSVHIARLRRTLGIFNGAGYILTEPGRGYRWRFPVVTEL